MGEVRPHPPHNPGQGGQLAVGVVLGYRTPNMATRYWLIPSKVTKFTSSSQKLVFKETTLTLPPTHSVTWTNEDHVSRLYTTWMNGAQYVGPPKVNDEILLALSDAYCDQENISKAGRTKKPAELDASAALEGDWFALRVDTPESLVLKLKSGKQVDLWNAPLALRDSVHVDAEGQLSVLLTALGRSQLGLPGLSEPFVGSLDSFRASIRGAASGAAAAGGSADRAKLKALLLSLAAVLD